MKRGIIPTSPLLIAAIQLGLLFFFIYYTFIGGQTAQGIYDHQWRLITLWVMSLLIGVWLLLRLGGHHRIPRTPFDLPLLFLLGAWLLSTIFSVNSIYSQETLVFFVIYLFFFYIAVDLGRWGWFKELVFNAVIGVSGLVWVLALWQLLHWYQNAAVVPAALQQSYNRFDALPRLSVLGNPNTMASYVALVLPLVIYKMIVVNKPVTRILLAVWGIMLPVMLLLTQSRGGLLALITGLVFYASIWVWQRINVTGKKDNVTVPHQPKSGSHRRVWLVVVAVVVVVLVAGWAVFRVRNISEGIDIRLQVINGAFVTVAKHPVFGSGPGTLGEELIRHQRPLHIIWADAHNMFLTFMAETGLVGVLALAWLGLAAAKFLWFVWQNVDSTRESMAGMACMASLVGFAAHGLVDSQFKFPAIMLLVAVLAGFGVVPYLTQGLSEKYWPTYRVVAALVLVAATTFMGVRGIKNISLYNQAVVAANQNDWVRALGFLQTADQLAPQVPFYQSQLGLVNGLLADGESPYHSEATYRVEAIEYYRSAIRRLNTLAVDHANLACLLAADGQQTAALDAMTTAHRLEPENLLYRLNLGHYYETQNDFQRAGAEYAGVIARQPGYLQSSYWRQNEERLTALPEIIKQAAHILNTQGDKSLVDLAELNLYAESYGNALQRYEEILVRDNSSPVDAYVGKARALLAMGRIDEAKRTLDTAVESDAKDGKVYLYLSQITLAQGDVAAAAEYITVARFLNEADGEILYQAALVAEAESDYTTAVTDYEAAFWQTLPPPPANIARYATEVARRRPLPAAYLPCLVQIYPTPLLVAISEAEGALLEREGHIREAVQVYQRLERYEPDAMVITAKLAALCRQHPDICEE